MWLFTTNGFYSVVRDNETEGGLLIRAREIGHLASLCDEVEWKRIRILETPGRDYRFRVAVSREEWDDVAGLLTARACGYDNFKSACQKKNYMGELDSAYVKTLSKVWQTMHDYQQANL